MTNRLRERRREGVRAVGHAICDLCGSEVDYQVWFPGAQPVMNDEFVAAMNYFVMLHQRLCRVVEEVTDGQV